MKKLILTFVLLLTVSFAFAGNEVEKTMNSNEEVEKTSTVEVEHDITMKFFIQKNDLILEKSCGELAFDVQDNLEAEGVCKERANKVANACYTICEMQRAENE